MTAPLLDVTGLRIEATTGQPVVDNLSFSLDPGDCMALVGESGSGKTMAARAVMRLLPPGLHRSGGRIVLDGRDVTDVPEGDFRRLRGPRLGMVFQEPMASLNPAMTVGAQMAEGLRLHLGLSARDAAARCAAMLERVGIGDATRRLRAYPHEFSGGMRQRIMLASVMLLRPRLLIADEPTTALDTLTQREVLDLMMGLARDEGTAVLLITHNLGLVARYARHALVMEAGRMVERGPVASLLSTPREPYTRALVAAVPSRATEPPVVHRGTPVVSVRDLAVTHAARMSLFRRRTPQRAVDGVSLDVHPGEVVALVGGSGCGKTTLGRAILRLVPAQAGAVLVDGVDVLQGDAATQRAWRLGAQLVFQDPFSSLDPRMRVAAIVQEPLRHVAGLDRAAQAARVARTLEDVGLGGLGERFPHQLSGGQRQRVAIARAIVRRPRFVVADEPVSALDMTIQAQILRLFKSLQVEYRFACLFVSHDLAAVGQIADRVIVMRDGRIVEEGPRDLVFDSPGHPYTQALLDAAPRLDGPAPSRPVAVS